MSEVHFIIDTNQYSGNFEREMCAYLTGHVGDRDAKGRRQAEEYLEEFELLEGVKHKPDENGSYRPVSICTTPNIWNNGLGFHYKEGEEELALRKYKEYVKKEKEQYIAIAEGHRGKNLPTWTDEAIDNAIVCYKDEIKRAENLTKVSKYPAYQSVEIYFDQEPADATIRFLKKRAEEFASFYKRSDITITGYRMVTIKEHKTEKKA